ncbi:MAG: hypothetical protein RL625_880 [Gemmatimonadota bacterium]
MTYLGEDPRLHAVHETLKAARAPRPRVAIIDPRAPLRAIGPWVTEVIRRAGGIEVLASDGSMADADLIIFAFAGETIDHATARGQHLLDDPAWAWARERRCLVMDASLLYESGPRLIDAVVALAPCIAPSLFAPAPTDQVRALTSPSA